MTIKYNIDDIRSGFKILLFFLMDSLSIAVLVFFPQWYTFLFSAILIFSLVRILDRQDGKLELYQNGSKLFLSKQVNTKDIEIVEIKESKFY